MEFRCLKNGELSRVPFSPMTSHLFNPREPFPQLRIYLPYHPRMKPTSKKHAFGLSFKPSRKFRLTDSSKLRKVPTTKPDIPQETKKMATKKRSHNYSASSQSTALGAISCLEELVKASTSGLYVATSAKATKTNKKSKVANKQTANFTMQNGVRHCLTYL